ncbi:MAG: T9SS type A sorting domain-containing protein, partial [Candidatus Zixiibacteriota bacterium]
YLLKIAGQAQEPDVSIEIVPDDPPVTVPQGGRFGYTGSLTNNTSELQVTDVWAMAVGPQEGIHGPFKEFYDLELDPYEAHTVHFNQHIPNLAPLGFYNYVAYCGDYPSSVTDSSFFEIEVIAGATGGHSWVLTGSFEKSAESVTLPSGFALLENYPNPFNASTSISFDLAEAGNVSLKVYDITGRLVATLVDGFQEAGHMSVTWDASMVSSGVYFYKLTAGDFTEVKRMTLLR